MGYTMKLGNNKVSYQDLLSESNQAITDATEEQRKASSLNFGKELEAGTDRVTPNSSTLKKKAGPEANLTPGSDNAEQDFEDREYAIEYAMNDNDLNDGEHPTEKQINENLRGIRAERKAGY